MWRDNDFGANSKNLAANKTLAMPHPVDRHVGRRVRVARQAKGASQMELAKALGITFQQVQKYETGANRISASRLWATCIELEVPISFMFDGLAEAKREAKEETDLLRRSIVLAYEIEKVGNEAVKHHFIELVKLYAKT